MERHRDQVDDGAPDQADDGEPRGADVLHDHCPDQHGYGR